MKKVAIASTNIKGQIVIPKPMRKALKISENTPLYITQRGGGIYIYPIQDVILSEEAENRSYMQILKETRGSWGSTSEEDKAREQEREKLELQASEKRKKQW